MNFVGTGVHVLAVDRALSDSSKIRYVHTAAPTATEAFNLNQIGLNQAAYHGAFVYGDAGILQVYPEDREGQIYTIEPRDPQRVIINRAGQDIPYTSPWQEQDRIIKFMVTGWSGLEFRLQLIDPPDTAPYAPEGGWDKGRAKKLPYEGNDNAEDLQTADVGLALSKDSPTWVKQLNVTPAGPYHTATVYLKVTDRYAGDNYQVEVMKCKPGGCATGLLSSRVVGLSPIFTAWKRIYLERDKMFRKGGVLYRSYGPKDPGCGGLNEPPCPFCGHDDYPACCGIGDGLPCDQIEVYDWLDVSPGDTIAVFDEADCYPHFNEEREVMDIEPGSQPYTKRVTLDTRLTQPYFASQVDSARNMPDFSNYHSAGIGVISNCDLAPNQINAPNSCFYQADPRSTEQAFNDAFIEVSSPRDGMSALPYLGPQWVLAAPTVYYQRLSQTWFAHSGTTHNYFHLLAGSKDQTDNNVSLWGWTDPDWNFTYVFRGSCEASGTLFSKTAEEVNNFTQDTTVHELGHQWDLNCCSADGHDTRDAWCQVAGECGPGSSDPEKCVEAAGLSGSIWDGVSRFCVDDLFSGDPTCGSGVTEFGLAGTCPLDETSMRKAPDPR